jgi:hypothetical protein
MRRFERAPAVVSRTQGRWGFPLLNIQGQKPRNPYLTNVRNTDRALEPTATLSNSKRYLCEPLMPSAQKAVCEEFDKRKATSHV